MEDLYKIEQVGISILRQKATIVKLKNKRTLIALITNMGFRNKSKKGVEISYINLDNNCHEHLQLSAINYIKILDNSWIKTLTNLGKNNDDFYNSFVHGNWC